MKLKADSIVQKFGLCLAITIIVSVQDFAVLQIKDANESQQIINRQSELSKHLEELIGQLRQERSDYYSAKAQYDIQIDKAHENRKILQQELNELRQQETQSDQQLLEYKTEVRDIEKQLVSKKALEELLNEQMESFLIREQSAIKEGIPYKRQERLLRLEAVKHDINDPNRISLSNQLEHLWSYTLEELRISRSSETYTDRAKTEDESLPYARFFRVGHNILGYITEDGQKAAMWSPLSKQNDWLFYNNKSQKEQIITAVEILDNHQIPKLVMLPITLKAEKTDPEDFNVSP